MYKHLCLRGLLKGEMKRIRVTKEFTFEMAHALWNYDGACRNIHGHSYRLFVTIIGEPEQDEQNAKFGMVMDFKDLKDVVRQKITSRLDHSLVVYKNAESNTLDSVRSMYDKVYVFDFQPTCENLVSYIADKMTKALPNGVTLHSLKLYETASSYAEWYASDN